jgi:protocatechuate 3,4-dioxygenase, beta subunit
MNHFLSRRQVLSASARLLSVLPIAGVPMTNTVRAQTAAGSTSRSSQTLRKTPSQMEGPFYPVVEPKDADYDLLRNGTLTYTGGSPTWVEGVVTDLEGMPLKGGSIEIWQCDEAGHYDHPSDGSKINPAFQGFGRVVLNAEGQFRFRTIKPVPYTGRTPHIHAKIKLGKRELLTTQFYVEDDPGNARDMLFRRMKAEDRALITAPFVLVSDGLLAKYSVVVDA